MKNYKKIKKLVYPSASEYLICFRFRIYLTDPCSLSLSFNIYIYIYIYKVKLVSKVGDQKAPFSIASTLRRRVGHYSFPRIAPLYPWYIPYIAVLSKEVLSTIFKVFGMTQPGIEHRSPGPSANTLPTRPMNRPLILSLSIYIFHWFSFSLSLSLYVYIIDSLSIYISRFYFVNRDHVWVPNSSVKDWFLCLMAYQPSWVI